MGKIFLYIALIIFSLGCEKEEMTNHYAKWVNSTSHIIEIRPFIGGILQNDKIVTLLPDSIMLIGKGSIRGINEIGTGFYSDYVNYSDSIQVIFDNQYKITHYVQSPLNFAPKYYIYTSEENILNIKSYEGTIVDDDKHRRTIHYSYTFTEQHFLDAK